MATHPEHTIPGFLHAMACGADGVELDVAVTLDDALVVTHDLILVVTHDLILEAGGRIVPSLDEVLRLQSPENFQFDIEAKVAPGLTPPVERYARLLSEAIRRSPVRHRVVVRSFDHGILRAFHALDPDIPLAALIGCQSDAWPSIARAANASIVSPHASTVTGERVRKAHDAGIRVSVWTVNQPKDWDRLAALGVDAIITDDPAAAVTYFSR